jgi:hypothetical protein
VRYEFIGMVFRAVRFQAASLILVWFAVAPCHGEPTPQAVKLARKRFIEGVAAVDAGKYEAARLAFQQAYALKPHPAILRNLGQAEWQLGRYLEAARHLSMFLRETNFGTEQERAVAQKTLTQAETKVGKLLVDATEGAEVSVDGELVGSAPLGPDPFYVEPGQRTVRLRKDGYAIYEGVHTFESGRTTHLRIDLKALEPSETLAEPTVTLAAAPAAPAATEQPALPPAGLESPTPASAPPSDAPSSRSPGRVVALTTTAGLTVISAGVWIGFALWGASLQRHETDLRNNIGMQGGSDKEDPRCRPVCEDLTQTSNQRATANQVALIGGVATGLSAAAFIGTWLFWPKGGPPAGTSLLLPHVSPNRAGIDLVGVLE